MARILITSGPTREYLDPVRFLSNDSSGRMGAALAAEALRRGCEVDFVTGPAPVPPPAGVNAIRVTTAAQMLEAARELHPRCEALIGAAAVSDFRPARALQAKQPGGAPWRLELLPNPDILELLGRSKGGRIHAGFSLETAGEEEARRRARRKLERKNLDWMVLNPAAAIGAEEGTFILIPREGAEVRLGRVSKEELARALLERLLDRRLPG